MLQLNSSGPNISTFQKVIAWVIMAAVGFGVLKIFNGYLAPFFLDVFDNVWMLLLKGVPLALLIMYVLTNPTFIWGLFKTLSFKLTAWAIKQDPLSVMDRHVDYLKLKLQSLSRTIDILSGKKVKLDRNIDDLGVKVKENLKMGKAAIHAGNETAAALFGTKVQTDQSTIDMLKPMQERAEKSLTFLNSLAENWKFNTEKLEYQIQGKRAEYEIIKETARGLRTAEDFINSDNDAAKLYGMSVKALEEKVTQQIGYIDEFEKRSKNIMDNITIEKQSIKDEGLAVLEQYMRDDNLKLDFSSAPLGSIANPIKIRESKSQFNFNKD